MQLNFDGTGVGRDAGDLIRIYLWARPCDDPATFARLFLKSLYVRYARSSRITVPMVDRHIGDVEEAVATREP